MADIYLCQIYTVRPWPFACMNCPLQKPVLPWTFGCQCPNLGIHHAHIKQYAYGECPIGLFKKQLFQAGTPANRFSHCKGQYKIGTKKIFEKEEHLGLRQLFQLGTEA